MGEKEKLNRLRHELKLLLLEKMVLKITLILASGRKRIQARCKDLVKVTVKLFPHRKWEQRLKMVVPNS
jgi:hypothetical protein